MNFDFISLRKLGVGCVLIRHSEIVELEPTHHDFTRIELSTGNYLIVEHGPLEILNLIDNLEQLRKAAEDVEAAKNDETPKIDDFTKLSNRALFGVTNGERSHTTSFTD